MNWKKEVFVVGYPRSGNTWTARLLGDVLASRVTGFPGESPLAEDGPDRKGPYIVRQSHLRVTRGKDFDDLVGNYNFYIDNYDKNNDPAIVHVIRDPRDMLVSYMYYHRIPTLLLTCECVMTENNPLSCSWGNYVNGWMDASRIISRMITVRYGDLLSETEIELTRILRWLGLKYNKDRIRPSVDRQSFRKKREAIQRLEGLYYGTRIMHLRHMRKGKAGDWKNHFNRSCGKKVEEAYGELMQELGYEDNRNWWGELPE